MSPSVRPLVVSIAILLTAALLIPTARAQMISADDFSVRAGGGAGFSPDYMGSDHSKLVFRPDAEIVYQKHLFASTRYGGGLFLFNDSGTRLGIAVGPNFGRKDDANTYLAGLGDIKFGWDLNMFLDGNFDPFLAGLAVRHGISGGSSGTVVSGYIGFRQHFSEHLTGTLRTSLSWADTDWTRDYFAVSSTQSVNSGLPAYAADDGLRDGTVSGELSYALTPNVALTGTARYSRLLDDAADSPVTRSADQFVFTLGATYSWPATR